MTCSCSQKSALKIAEPWLAVVQKLLRRNQRPQHARAEARCAGQQCCVVGAGVRRRVGKGCASCLAAGQMLAVGQHGHRAGADAGAGPPEVPLIRIPRLLCLPVVIHSIYPSCNLRWLAGCGCWCRAIGTFSHWLPGCAAPAAAPSCRRMNSCGSTYRVLVDARWDLWPDVLFGAAQRGTGRDGCRRRGWASTSAWENNQMKELYVGNRS